MQKEQVSDTEKIQFLEKKVADQDEKFSQILIEVNSLKKQIQNQRERYEKQINLIIKELDKEKEINKKISLELQAMESVTLEEKVKTLTMEKEKAEDYAKEMAAKSEDWRMKYVKLEEFARSTSEKCKHLQIAVEKLRSDLEQAQTGNQPSSMSQYAEVLQENELLKSQVSIIKSDFNNERKDRERAQAEIYELKQQLKQRLEQESRSSQMTKEIQALRETRAKQERTIHNLQEELDVLRRQHGKGTAAPPEKVTPYGMPITAPDEFLTTQQKSKIQSHYSDLTHYLRTPSEIASFLYANRHLTMRDMEKFKHTNTDMDGAQFLIDKVLLLGTQKSLKVFKEALVKTGQRELAMLLPDPQFSQSSPKKVGSGHENILGREQGMDVGPSDLQGTWECPQCTFQNRSPGTYCEMCGCHRLLGGRGQDLTARGLIEQCDLR